MTFLSSQYKEWRRASKKGDLKFYASAEFRSDYTFMEMDRKATLFMERVMPDVKAVLSEILEKTDRDEIRILSLGCGPGSDLLGILRAVDSVLWNGDAGLGWKTGQLKCHCTGVDAVDWNRDAFEQRISSAGFCSVFNQFCFVHENMYDFVRRSREDDGFRMVDFICLSFANAGSLLSLIGRSMPFLLSEFGRILVLDNDIPMVRNLAVYGFRCNSVLNEIAMYSVDRDTAMSKQPPVLSENRTVAECMEYLLHIHWWEVRGTD